MAGGKGYVLDGRLNASFKAVNLLLGKGIKVRRVDKDTSGLRPGDFIVAAGSESTLREVARQTGVDFEALESEPSAFHEIEPLRHLNNRLKHGRAQRSFEFEEPPTYFGVESRDLKALVDRSLAERFRFPLPESYALWV